MTLAKASLGRNGHRSVICRITRTRAGFCDLTVVGRPQNKQFWVTETQQALGRSAQASPPGRPVAGLGARMVEPTFASCDSAMCLMNCLCCPASLVGTQETALIGQITAALTTLYPQALYKSSILEHCCQTTSFPRVAGDIKSIRLSLKS